MTVRHFSAAILCGVAVNCLAETTAYGDWIVTTTEGGTGDTVAATFADGTSSALAVRCQGVTKQCFHLVRLGTKCEDGAAYPILINAPRAAVSVTGICNINAGESELYLTPFDDVRGLLSDDGMIGIAVPMASGAFKAVRFSLNGSTRAIKVGEDWASSGTGARTTNTNKRGSFRF